MKLKLKFYLGLLKMYLLLYRISVIDFKYPIKLSALMSK